MSLHSRATESGLVVTEEVVGEAALKRALHQIDPQLSLQFRAPYYVVVCMVNDHYAPVVATWMDLDGRPLPLSSGLLEKVQMWRLGARNAPESVDEFNARRQQEIEKDMERELEALRDDHRAKIERGQVSVTFADVSPRRVRNKRPPVSSGLKRG